MDFQKSHMARMKIFNIIWYLALAYVLIVIIGSCLHSIAGIDLRNELSSLSNRPRTMYVKVLERFDTNLNIGNVESGYLVQRLDKKGEKLYLEATGSHFNIGDNLKVKVQRLREKQFSSWTANRFKADIKVYALKEAELASVEKDEGEER